MKCIHIQQTEACILHKTNMNIHKTHMYVNILSHKHMHTLIYSCKYNTHVHIITWDKIYI